jgi:hypothetical protein
MISGSLIKGEGGKILPAPGSTPRDPCVGFLNVSFDVVVSMIEAQCGVWAFFGGPYGADIMHFDIQSGAKFT